MSGKSEAQIFPFGSRANAAAAPAALPVLTPAWRFAVHLKHVPMLFAVPSATPASRHSAPNDAAAPASPHRAGVKMEWALGLATLFAASLPVLYGYLTTPSGHVFTGLTYNQDDGAVYLAWMRQIADGGQFFQRNPFTTQSENAVLFNAFFLLLGWLARLTHLPLIAVYHVARVGFGGAFLLASYRLIREALQNERARKVAFALVCVASGLGWLTGGYDPGKAYAQPIDLWQPEAIPFLSIYYTPLFAAALAAIAVFVASVLRAEKTVKLRDIWPAALMGLLLGNFHSYDVIPLFLAWGAYRIVSDALARRVDFGGWTRLIFAGLSTCPTVGYQLYAVQADPVFRARALVSTTLTPSLIWIIAGFGLPFLLAVCAPFLPRVRAAFANPSALRFLCVWALVGIAAAYLPFAFQRKLIMGAFVPLCVLGGATLAALGELLPARYAKLALALAVLLTVPSNALWFLQDTSRLDANVGSTARRPYLTTDESNALQWLHDHTKPSDGVLVSPDPTAHKRFPFVALDAHLAPYVPAFAGNRVYNGHWSETPDYAKTFSDTVRFFAASTTETNRLFFVEENHIRYILYNNALADGPVTNPATGQIVYVPVAWRGVAGASVLHPAFESKEVTIYAVGLPQHGDAFQSTAPTDREGR